MPVYLREIDEISALEASRAVLIIPCRFCPAASMAVSEKEPYFKFLRHFLKTDAYERYIERTRSTLEAKGVATDVFRSYLPHQFVVCLWTSRRREKLLKRARNYDALMVMGCEAALDTVCDAVKSTDCNVFQAMRSEGMMSILPRFQKPCNISLELNRITPLIHDSSKEVPWARL